MYNESIVFLGNEIVYTKTVLTPRLETEALVLGGLRRSEGARFFLDIGTGSGAIACAIARLRPEKNIHVVASDISESALLVARANIDRLGFQIEVKCGDLLLPFLEDMAFLQSIQHEMVSCFANLPYIALGEDLGEGVAEHDPAIALFGGGDRGWGCIAEFLGQIRMLAIKAPTSTFRIFLEFGHLQSDLFLAWARENAIEFGVFSDYRGVNRFGYATLKK